MPRREICSRLVAALVLVATSCSGATSGAALTPSAAARPSGGVSTILEETPASASPVHRGESPELAPRTSDAPSVLFDDPVRIMLLGDSITEGTYFRAPLVQLLGDAGCRVDLVGSRSSPDTIPADPDHEGYSGKTAVYLATRAARLFRLAEPEIIVIHIGINDLAGGLTPADTAEAVDTLLDAAAEQRRGAIVLLARIVPAEGLGPEVDELNELISRLGAKWHGRPALDVRIVDQAAGVNPSRDMADGIHPGERLGRQMAQRWMTALDPILGDRCSDRTRPVSPSLSER